MHYVRTSAKHEPDSDQEPEEPTAVSITQPAHQQAAQIEEPADTPQFVSRVHQKLVGESDEAPLNTRDLARGYEVEPDRYVVVEQEELRRLRPKTSPDMQLESFVPLTGIDPVYYETSYYVIPDAGGEKPYAVLFSVMNNTKHAGVAKITMHGREHVVIVRAARSGLMAHTMFYSDEVRGESEYRTDTSLVSQKELELATAFVDALAAPFDPEQFKDTYREQLKALIEGKAASQPVKASAPVPAPAPVDILDALKASMEQAKKSAAPERKAPAKVTELPAKQRRKKA
jgi:DNA end-binding protein Ku